MPSPGTSGFGALAEPAGDVNGDGVTDLLVREGPDDTGQVLLHLFLVGCDGTMPSEPASTIVGTHSASEQGFAVKFGGGDFDADGYSDVAVLQDWWMSDPSCLDGEWSCYYCNQGRVLVFKGSPSGLGGRTLTAADADWTITVEEGVHQPGEITDFAIGDVTDDGIPDILVLDHAWDPNTRWCRNYNNDPEAPLDLEGDFMGRVEIYAGGSGFGSLTRAILPPTPYPMSHFRAYGLAALGDVDGASGADLGVSAQFEDEGTWHRGVQVYDGSSGDHRFNVRADEVDEMDPRHEMVLQCASGDVNGDGLGDFTATVLRQDSMGRYFTVLYSFLGSPSGPVKDFRLADTDAWLGQVSPIGDWNADGFADVAAVRVSSSGTAVRMHLGSSTGLSLGSMLDLDLSDCPEATPQSVAGLGDVTGDGFGELAIGRPSSFDATCNSRVDLVTSDDAPLPPPPPPPPECEGGEPYPGCCSRSQLDPPEGLSVKVATVSFRSITPDAPIVHDDRGTPYSPPQWRDLDLDGVIAPTDSCTTTLADDQRERQFPVLFTAGDCPLVRAVFKFNQVFDRACVHVRGDGPGPMRFGGFADVVGGVLETGWMASAEPLPAVVQKVGVTIAWELSLDGGSSWTAAGQSFNGMYVSLAPATGNSDTGGKVYESAIDIACESAHGLSTSEEVLWAIWQAFEIPTSTLTRKAVDGYQQSDGESLKFWADEHLASPEYLALIQLQDEVHELLDPCASRSPHDLNGRGTCTAFTMLLDACFRSAGLDPALWSPTEVISNLRWVPESTVKRSDMLVKNYSFSNSATYQCVGETEWTHRYHPTTPIECMPIGGVMGQGVSNPTSSFENHVLIKVNDQVLDPSYGRRFETEALWEAGSLAGHVGGCIANPDSRGAIPDAPGRHTSFRGWGG